MTTSNESDPLQLLSINQTAELLAVCPRTVRRLIKKKTLSSVRIAGAVRIRRSNIEILLQLNSDI